MSFLTSALKYAEIKWPVFPVIGKAAAVATGFKAATCNRLQIRQWWTERPNCNIGTPTGLRFWVLDVDPRHGGDITLEDLIAKHGPLPNTVQQISGGGGRHYLFEMPDQREIRCGILGPGIDIKGVGGYIVVAPSIHPDTGREYVWDGLAPLAEQPILPAPAWLLPGNKKARAKVAGDGSKVLPKKIPKGQQHASLVSLAGTMRQRGCEFPEIFAALMAMNPRLEEPAPEANLRKIAESVCKLYPPGPTIAVNVDAADASLELLNACQIFGGRIRFTAVERRGQMIVARFAGIQVEAIWPSIQDLISFSKSQAILAETTQTLIPTPSRRAAKAAWEPTCQLIMRLAGTSDITSMDSLRDEFADILRTTWKRAGTPNATNATDDAKFLELLRACQTHTRNPHGPPPDHCVWHDGEHCYVHQPSLIEWLSTPAGRNKQYDWSDVRKALLLLGFEREQIHRSCRKVSVETGKEIVETVNVRLWLGPLELLIDDET